MPGLHLFSCSFYIENMHVTWQKITTQQPSPSGRLNVRVHIEKHTSVLRSGIKKTELPIRLKITAVNIIAFDNYCGFFFFQQEASFLLEAVVNVG